MVKIMNKAIFLDRDGTINYDYDHVFQVDRIKLLDGAAKAIGDLRRAGYKIFIISNQSCIGRGYAKEEEVIACMDKVSELISVEDPDALIDEAFFATEHPEKSIGRRKPNPAMILEAINKHNLNPSLCWMIGDRLSDPMSGCNAGLESKKCILVEPNAVADTLPKTEIQKAIDKNFRYFKDLQSTVEAILNPIDPAP